VRRHDGRERRLRGHRAVRVRPAAVLPRGGHSGGLRNPRLGIGRLRGRARDLAGARGRLRDAATRRRRERAVDRRPPGRRHGVVARATYRLRGLQGPGAHRRADPGLRGPGAELRAWTWRRWRLARSRRKRRKRRKRGVVLLDRKLGDRLRRGHTPADVRRGRGAPRVLPPVRCRSSAPGSPGVRRRNCASSFGG
jgi:hypothetical protein